MMVTVLHLLGKMSEKEEGIRCIVELATEEEQKKRERGRRTNTKEPW